MTSLSSFRQFKHIVLVISLEISIISDRQAIIVVDEGTEEKQIGKIGMEIALLQLKITRLDEYVEEMKTKHKEEIMKSMGQATISWSMQ